MLNFCTLFDSNYLAKGLCMIESLSKVCADFHLYIFAFDEATYQIIDGLRLENVSVIPLSDFEDAELLKVKPERSTAEYCWTATPSTIIYCLNKFEINHCIYIDADLFFYCDPGVLIEETGNNDVLITEHRYSAAYDQSKQSGKYCVQFIYFRNNENGIKILEWWRKACLDWCYAKVEDGKFGDQKYLDDWTKRFKNIHVLNHLGGGVAPWNVQQYRFFIEDGKLRFMNKSDNSVYNLVFFHFHNVNNQMIGPFNEFNLGSYIIDKNVVRLIYLPYINKLKSKDLFLKTIDNSFDSLGSKRIHISHIRIGAHIIRNIYRRNRLIWKR